MAQNERSGSVDVGALLAGILGDARGEDEQLRTLHRALSAALDLPLEVRVAGEPMSLLAVEYGGRPRLGLVAHCRREDGSEHRVTLADVQMIDAQAAGYPHMTAYGLWLGIEPAGAAPATKGGTKVRGNGMGEDELDLSKPVELVVLQVKLRGARCRLPGGKGILTLRARGLHRVVPGHIATVRPVKQWRHAGHPYLSGEIVSTRIDAGALGLVPLELRDQGDWDPAEHYWGEESNPIDPWAEPIIARGPRPMLEMEQVMPGRDPSDLDSHPILQAHELAEMGQHAAARELLGKLLEADLRCLDAHGLLGNMHFRRAPDLALCHYEAGVRIGELSLGERFEGVLAWVLIDNRPFLRCMHGCGLCLWRLERWDEAEGVLERILWMNPTDNQGTRFLLPQVRARKPWSE